MTRLIWFGAFMATFAPATTTPLGGYDFPPRQWPNMVARLRVRVADQPDAAGCARVTLTVSVEGPQTLEVAPVLLGDATDAWKPERSSSQRIEDGRAKWEETIDLRQVKAGLAPVPSVKVRCRENADAAWEEVEWTNILTDLHDLRPPGIPKPGPSAGLWWLWAAAGLTLALGFGAAVYWRARRRPPPRVLTHEERALAELARLETTLSLPAHDHRVFSEKLSMLLRRYVAERFALPAPRQTTDEFLESVGKTTTVPETHREPLRTFLERCDLVKFAGVSLTVEECRESVEFVRAFIRIPEAEGAAKPS